ncbi:uncharacterized protein [Elaeis guineensis]|uniref:uncharacterized protein isoform X2 n=1 Tax=Elaeis guineensis var. tenera TaxID=51953 RepID=UPI003C6DA593
MEFLRVLVLGVKIPSKEFLRREIRSPPSSCFPSKGMMPREFTRLSCGAWRACEVEDLHIHISRVAKEELCTWDVWDCSFLIADVDMRYPSRVAQGGYDAYNAHITAATHYAAQGAPTLYDFPGSAYGRYLGPYRGLGKEIFVGRIPQEASADDLRQYFSRFGRVLDVYIPKDPKRTEHRGFGFVAFAEDGVADHVYCRTHQILGQEVAIDSVIAPLRRAGSSGSNMDAAAAHGGYGPMQTYGWPHRNLNFGDYGDGATGSSRP